MFSDRKLLVADCLRGAHAQQLDFSQNLQLCDLLQVRNSVFVVQLVDSIDSHLEVMKVAEDNDLQENINNVIPGWQMRAINLTKFKCVA